MKKLNEESQKILKSLREKMEDGKATFKRKNGFLPLTVEEVKWKENTIIKISHYLEDNEGGVRDLQVQILEKDGDFHPIGMVIEPAKINSQAIQDEGGKQKLLKDLQIHIADFTDGWLISIKEEGLI